jgi:hypothetical protein
MAAAGCNCAALDETRNGDPLMETTHLRDLVEQRINQRWADWSRAHPNLAEAIDRTRLVETSVERLRDDPRFMQAMNAAAVDEHRVAAMERLVSLVEALVVRLLPLP